MATVTLSTSPTQIDAGSSYSVLVANTGSSPVELSRGGRLRPGQTQTVYPEGSALTAVSLSGAGQVTTTTVAGKPLPNPSDPSTLATDPAFTGTYARKVGHTVAILGDSITANNWLQQAINSDFQYLAQAKGYWTWAQAALGGVTAWTTYSASQWPFAQSGATCQELIDAGYVDAVIASDAAWVVLCCGSNDVFRLSVSATGAQVSASLQAIAARLTAAGKRVVVCAIPPRAQTTGETNQQMIESRRGNELIRRWARATPGIVLCDWYSILIDTSTGKANTAYLLDGVHPNAAGASRMGYVLANALRPFVSGAADLTLDTTGILGSTGFMVGTSGTTGGAGTVSGSWATGVIAQPDTGVTIAGSKVARTDGIPGEWQQVVQSVGTGGFTLNLRSSLNNGYALGDQIYGVVEYETDAASFAFKQMQATLLCYSDQVPQSVYGYINSSDLTALTQPIFQPAVAKGVMVTPPITVKTVTTTPTRIHLDLRCAGGTGTIRFGRAQVVKV